MRPLVSLMSSELIAVMPPNRFCKPVPSSMVMLEGGTGVSATGAAVAAMASSRRPPRRGSRNRPSGRSEAFTGEVVAAFARARRITSATM